MLISSPHRFMLLFIPAALMLAGCKDNNSSEPVSDKANSVQTAVDMEPFRALARASNCADKTNRLFLIDDRLVFWDRDSRCADASYARVLYAGRVDHVVCDLHDSIAGPQRSCKDAGDDVALFDIMLEHLDAPDLGLGSEHTVKRVEF